MVVFAGEAGLAIEQPEADSYELLGPWRDDWDASGMRLGEARHFSGTSKL